MNRIARRVLQIALGVGVAALIVWEPAMAQDAAAPASAGPKIDTGDTAWMLTSTALVLMMTIPGLALFYGGMVRKKNVLATMAQSFGATCIITVLMDGDRLFHRLHHQRQRRSEQLVRRV